MLPNLTNNHPLQDKNRKIRKCPLCGSLQKRLPNHLAGKLHGLAPGPEKTRLLQEAIIGRLLNKDLCIYASVCFCSGHSWNKKPNPNLICIVTDWFCDDQLTQLWPPINQQSHTQIHLEPSTPIWGVSCLSIWNTVAFSKTFVGIILFVYLCSKNTGILGYFQKTSLWCKNTLWMIYLTCLTNKMVTILLVWQNKCTICTSQA